MHLPKIKPQINFFFFFFASRLCDIPWNFMLNWDSTVWLFEGPNFGISKFIEANRRLRVWYRLVPKSQTGSWSLWWSNKKRKVRWFYHLDQGEYPMLPLRWSLLLLKVCECSSFKKRLRLLTQVIIIYLISAGELNLRERWHSSPVSSVWLFMCDELLQWKQQWFLLLNIFVLWLLCGKDIQSFFLQFCLLFQSSRSNLFFYLLFAAAFDKSVWSLPFSIFSGSASRSLFLMFTEAKDVY